MYSALVITEEPLITHLFIKKLEKIEENMI